MGRDAAFDFPNLIKPLQFMPKVQCPLNFFRSFVLCDITL